MTVTELIATLQGKPGGLEVRVIKPNRIGGMDAQRAYSVRIEHDDPQDKTSAQYLLIE
jgi:hypothetical protein